MLDPWNMTNGRLKKRLYLALRMRKNLNRAAALHFTTQTERDAVARLKLKPRAIIEPLGLDVAEFQNLPAPGTFRSKYPQLQGKRLITFLGRLDKGKGLELLIPAFARLAETFNDIQLVIVGPDSHSGYRATVESMIRRHNLSPRTLLTGMLKGPEKLAALVDSYLLCQPSFHENFGMVVVEALACGTPAIVSDEVYLHPEVTGAHVGDVTTTTIESVHAKLLHWLQHPDQRNTASAAARPFALQIFDWNHIARHWVEHYRALTLAPHSSAGPSSR
jgi:glycosyltransferase involved in cell wall biosynthesis